MNRKSALKTRESCRDLAGEIVYNRSADFAGGREQPVFDEQAVTPKFKFPNPKLQLSTNYQSYKRRMSGFLGLSPLASGVRPTDVRLSTNKFQSKIINHSVIHAIIHSCKK